MRGRCSLAIVYVWHPPVPCRSITVADALVALASRFGAGSYWAKAHLPIGRGNYHVQHEPCWYAVRGSRSLAR